jgi:hypothetical protein
MVKDVFPREIPGFADTAAKSSRIKGIPPMSNMIHVILEMACLHLRTLSTAKTVFREDMLGDGIASLI